MPDTHDALRRVILFISAAGTLLFAGALIVSHTRPHLVEAGLREVLRIQIERETGARVDALLETRVVGLAEQALGRTDGELRQARAGIRQEIPRQVALVLDAMTRADCACRRRLEAAMRDPARQRRIEAAERALEQRRLRSLIEVRARLAGMIESAYAHVAASLQREFRIFTGSNAVAFALMGVVATTRRRTVLQLVLPALALGAALLVTGGLYLLRQDWLHTIIFNQYAGWTYALWLGGVALLLLDVLMNRARLSTRVVNLLLNAVGSTLTAVSC